MLRRRRRSFASAAAVFLALTLGATGCSAETAGQAASDAPKPSASPTPTQTATPVDPVLAYAKARLSTMTLREKVASLLMLAAPGTDPAGLHDFMARTGAGGFILMGSNVTGTAADLAPISAALTIDPSMPPIVATDQEGGEVARLDDPFAGAEQLRSEPPAATASAFADRSQMLKAGGVDLNFGIIADTTSDPNSFIYDRILGTNAADSAARVDQAVAGEKGNVLSTLKHFPGHGVSEDNSHLTVPTSDIGYAQWDAEDAPPFEAGIDAGAEVVMFGHLLLPAIDPSPASLSARWHEILRKDLGFTGITITDDMLMLQHTELPQYADPTENAIAALNAGNTMLLYVLAADPAVSGVDPVQLVDALTAAVQAGRIDPTTVDADALALLQLRRHLAIAP